jgi:hypothetical protein
LKQNNKFGSKRRKKKEGVMLYFLSRNTSSDANEAATSKILCSLHITAASAPASNHGT